MEKYHSVKLYIDSLIFVKTCIDIKEVIQIYELGLMLLIEKLLLLFG